MFEFLFGKKKQQIVLGTSKVWQTSEVKWNVICDEVKKSTAISLFYFEEKTKSELIKQLERVGVVESESVRFYNMNFPERVRFINQDSHCFFIEHAFSFEQEQKALRYLSEVCGKLIVDFYVSFDDELFLKYIGTNLKELMVKLGASKDEMISHKMIDQSIVRCQQKFDKEH